MSFWAKLNPRRWRFRTVLWPGVLVGVGWGVWFFSNPVPRWQTPMPMWRTSSNFEAVSFLGFTPNAQLVVMTQTVTEGPGEQRRTFSYWDLATGKRVGFFEKSCTYFALSADFRFLAAGNGSRCWITDTQTGKEVLAATTESPDRIATPSLQFSRDGKYLTRHGEHLVLVESSTGSIRKTWDAFDGNPSFISDTNRLACFKQKGMVHIWDADANQPAGSFGPYAGIFGTDDKARFLLAQPTPLPLGPKGVVLAPPRLELIDLGAGKKLFQIPYDTERVRFAVSDDGGVLALWGQRIKGKDVSTIEFWSIPDGRKLSLLEVDYRDSYGFFAPNGSKLVLMTQKLWSPAADVRMIDVASGTLLWLREFRITPATGRFTPDSGAFLVSGLPEGAVGFLDCMTQELQHLHTTPNPSATFNFFVEPTPLSLPHKLVFRNHELKRALRIPLLNLEFSLGTADELVVVDTDKRQVQLTLPLEMIADCGVSAHGPTLVTCHQEGDEWYLAAWDLPPARPWLRIVGVPAVLWLVVAGLKWAVRRRQASKRNVLGQSTTLE
ncbi:MAG: hypothetical protein L0215_22230 [Gemmataceae bacterium]|nr:hypothetical protein [Gemmataceae bacterium]